MTLDLVYSNAVNLTLKHYIIFCNKIKPKYTLSDPIYSRLFAEFMHKVGENSFYVFIRDSVIFGVCVSFLQEIVTVNTVIICWKDKKLICKI